MKISINFYSDQNTVTNAFYVNEFNELVERTFGRGYDLIAEDDLSDSLMYVEYTSTDTSLSLDEVARLVDWMQGRDVFAPGPEIICSLLAKMELIRPGVTVIYL